jgi:adenylylsulfate kinase
MPMANNHIQWHHALVHRPDRQAQNGHRSVVLWFTGLSGAGKSTLAHAVEARLHALKCQTYVLDGDNVRHGLCADLGFTVADRAENIRRIGEVAKLFVDAGQIVLTAFISPFRADRAKVRAMIGDVDFIEIYCRCDMAICERRDVKGLYARARQGMVKEFTGISSPYEAPENAELEIDTGSISLEACVDSVFSLLQKRGVILNAE